jgi:glycosyltransferase involved in cell wall biosynthesis
MMGTPMPAVSVVMPVYNAAPFLRDSIRSILDQTFRDFELVVLENGSTDESREILRRYAGEDPRIRLFEESRPLGIVDGSNSAVERSTAPVVARMDADDVCHPERLERQLDVMRRGPDVVAVGTLSDGIDRDGRGVRPRDRWRLIRCAQVPFPHGSSMFRRDAFERIGGYQDGARISRDVDLFLRLADQGRILVLPEALYSYRYNVTSMSLSYSPEEVTRSIDLLLRSLATRRAGRTHEHLTELRPGQPLQPESIAGGLHLLGALRLWAGESPGVLRDLLGTGFRFNRTWLTTLVWAAWGEVSPGTLRLCLRCVVRAKDALAGLRIKDGRAYEWRLG